jgi:predicted transcriptional regulator
MQFPYTMIVVGCPTCHQTREAVDGNSLRAAREAAQVSLREMARRLGISASYLSDIERNRRNRSALFVARYQSKLSMRREKGGA